MTKFSNTIGIANIKNQHAVCLPKTFIKFSFYFHFDVVQYPLAVFHLKNGIL